MSKLKYIRVKHPIGTPETDAIQEHLRKKQEKRKHKDQGDYIPGSAKEKAAIRQLIRIEDLDKLELDEETAIRTVVKDNVWAAYDFTAMQDAGHCPVLAYFKNQMRRAFPPKPLNDSPAARRQYISSASFLQSVLDNLPNVVPFIIKEVSTRRWEITQEWYKLIFNPYSAIRFAPEVVAEYEKIKEKGLKRPGGMFPDSTLTVREEYRSYTYEQILDSGNDEFIDALTYVFDRNYISRKIKNHLGTQLFNVIYFQNPHLTNMVKVFHKNDWSWANQERKKTENTDDEGKLIINSGEELSHIIRKGGLLIDETKLDEKSLIEQYGFRAVQLGASIPDSVVKHHIRHFLGAITDLCEALDVDIKEIHKWGDLSIAFGARGKGRALAHYEPLHRIINLTRKKGDGTVAHEWGHYLDHVFGLSLTDKKTKLSFECIEFNSVGIYIHGIDENSKLFVDIDHVAQFMRFGGGRDNPSIGKMKYYARDARKNYGSLYEETIDKTLDILKWNFPNYFKAGAASNAKDVFTSIAKHFGVPFIEVPMKYEKVSEYYHNCAAYGSPYWRSSVEMFARAFECYVFDQLKAKGITNNYLTKSENHYLTHKVYPQGSEREELNKRIQFLIDDAREHYGLGRFKPFTTERVDEYISLKDNGDTDEGTVFVSEDKNQTKKQNNKITKKQNDDESALALALAMQLKMKLVKLRLRLKQSNDTPKQETQSKDAPVVEKPSPPSKLNLTLPEKGEREFVEFMHQQLIDKATHNKLTVEKIAKQHGINDPTDVRELMELAIVMEARRRTKQIDSIRETFNSIVDLYQSQVNLSHRSSTTLQMNQFSTSCPIAFMAGMWVMHTHKQARYFEPSAGNGLLCHALPYSQLYVNEFDEKRRLINLKAQPFYQVTYRDASKSFDDEYRKLFDGVLTNPPFGKIDKDDIHVNLDGYVISKLEHVMAIVALNCMKDNGRCAIIVGGHTEYDDYKGNIPKKSDRFFLNYLYHFYNVIDIINIDGHKLYSRQGTSARMRLILIDGRKEEPGGFAEFAPLHMASAKHLREVVDSFDRFYERMIAADVLHFSDLQRHFDAHEKPFEVQSGLRVTVPGTEAYEVKDGVVEQSPERGYWMVRCSKKETLKVSESAIIPQIISVSEEKNGQGYKAFKSIKSEFDIKHYRVSFADKTDTIVSADDKADARYKGYKWKLQNL